MFDPDFDRELLDFKSEPLVVAGPAVPRVKPTRFHLGNLRSLWPISRLSQAIFAEAFRQGLVEGLAFDHAVRLAAEVNPTRRFREALYQMALNIRAGDTLEAALSRTKAKVTASLLTALRVGEEHNCLSNALSAFATRTRGFTSSTYHRTIGRSAEAVQFANSLSRLLRDHRLNIAEIRAAGQVAADGSARFARVAEDIARKVEDGYSLVNALRLYPGRFDALFCGFLEAARSRLEMQACLERLGNQAP